jgi:proprotein convertase subtilisin/kexin type 5
MCDVTGKCQVCQNGFSYDKSTNTCTSCSKDMTCRVCNFSNYNCLSCMPNYFVDPVTKTCMSCPQGCSSCIDSKTCEINACLDGFYYNETLKTCTNCGQKCQRCNLGTKKCDACSSDTCLDPNKGTCEPMIPGCQSCSTNEICNSCISSFWKIEETQKCKTCDIGIFFF